MSLYSGEVRQIKKKNQFDEVSECNIIQLRNYMSTLTKKQKIEKRKIKSNEE